MLKKIITNSLSTRLYYWFYATNKLPINVADYRKKLAFMYLTIIPYWVLTLPGCFLEGSFCNKKRMNKLGLTLIGYFLLLVAGCMLLYPLSFFIVLPKSKLLTIAMYSSKAWLIIGAYALVILSMEFIKTQLRESRDKKMEELDNGFGIYSPNSNWINESVDRSNKTDFIHNL